MEAFTLSEVSLFSVWLLGISVGFTACTTSCLPYMGSWVFSRGTNLRTTLLDTSLFALGKICAYIFLGGLAGLIGAILLDYLKLGIGNGLIGLASIAAGAWLIRQQSRTHAGCGMSRRQHLPPMLLGFSLSFIPCAPLAALLAACANAGSATLGLSYGLMFGLGAALTPLFIVLPLLGSLGREIQLRHPWLKQGLAYVGGLVLIIIGVYRVQIAF